MQRVLIAVLAAALVAPPSAAAAKYTTATSRIADDGSLVVHVEQRGTGKRDVTYTLSATGHLWWACDGAPWARVSWSGIGWSEAAVIKSSSGRTAVDLVFRRADGSYSPCAGVLTRPWTRYDDIRVEDSDDGFVSLDPVETGSPF